MKLSKKPPLVVLLIIGCLAQAASLYAQVSFQFMPAVYGQTVNGLFTAQVFNSSAAQYHGKLKITVRDAASKSVLTAIAPVLVVKPGGNTLIATMSGSHLQFGNNAAGNMMAQTGRLPEGEYEYCFEFTGSDKANGTDPVFENCFNYLIQPLIPLSLMYPADGDEICNLRPELGWQPAIPLNSSIRYRVILTEKKDHQQDADALMSNVPVLQQDNIPGFMLMYPPQIAGLQRAKQYVWQVTAFLGSTKLTQSEIWSFSTSCDDKKADSSKESYRQLSAELNGNYYLAGNTLRFTITNPYSTITMTYSITDLSDPLKKIGNLPPVTLQTGLNKIDIAMEDVKGLETNKMYLLKIKNIGHQPLYLRFIYKGNAV